MPTASTGDMDINLTYPPLLIRQSHNRSTSSGRAISSMAYLRTRQAEGAELTAPRRGVEGEPTAAPQRLGYKRPARTPLANLPQQVQPEAGGADPKPPAGRHLAPQVCWRPSRQWQQSPQRLRFGVGGFAPVRRYSRLPLCSRRQARLRVLVGRPDPVRKHRSAAKRCKPSLTKPCTRVAASSGRTPQGGQRPTL